MILTCVHQTQRPKIETKWCHAPHNFNVDNKFEIVADNNFIYDTELNNKFREGEVNDRP